MAETLPGLGFVIKQSTAINRPFFFGTTGQTVTVTLSKNAAAFVANGGGSGAVTEIANGWYNIALTSGDTATAGMLAYHATASSGGPTDWQDYVQAQIFTDLLLDSSGRAKILNNLQQNTALNGFSFPMTSMTTGLRQTGLTVTAQRTLGSGGFAACANSVTEIGTTGIYAINLAAGDVNSATLGLLFTATGANDLYIPITPTP